MKTRMKTLPCLFLFIVLTGCGQAAPVTTPSVTPPAPTATEVRPTATPFSPTRTPIPTPTAYEKTPEQVGDGWQTGSLTDAKIDPLRISKMLEAIYRGNEQGDIPTMPNGARKIENIDSILIVREGRLVFEEYFNYHSRTNAHDLASVTKSITSILIGLAIEQGYIGSIQEKVLMYFPEYLPLQQEDPRKEDLTIEDLLTMRSGLECDDWDPASRSYYLKIQPDRPDEVKYILNIPLEITPETDFSYCTWGTVVLNALLIKTIGMELSEFANQCLFQPLGIRSVFWDGPFSTWKNMYGVALMTSRDMAKIGQLMLQTGKWNGEEIIPEAWIEQSTRQSEPLPFNTTWGKGYGYLWWISDVPIAGRTIHSFAASGYGGQVIAVFPDLDMVIVFTGSNYENDTGQPFDIMERYILPAILP
jgi:CubicO group peptidase (beta-lactamase class C family)